MHQVPLHKLLSHKKQGSNSGSDISESILTKPPKSLKISQIYSQKYRSKNLDRSAQYDQRAISTSKHKSPGPKGRGRKSKGRERGTKRMHPIDGSGHIISPPKRRVKEKESSLDQLLKSQPSTLPEDKEFSQSRIINESWPGVQINHNNHNSHGDHPLIKYGGDVCIENNDGEGQIHGLQDLSLPSQHVLKNIFFDNSLLSDSLSLKSVSSMGAHTVYSQPMYPHNTLLGGTQSNNIMGKDIYMSQDTPYLSSSPSSPTFSISTQSVAIIKSVMQSETSETLDQIKENSKEISQISRPGRQTTESLSHIIEMESMRFRHYSLLQEERELVLPLHYRQIWAMASALDVVINFFKARKKLTSFDNLQLAIKQGYHRNFSLQQFKQILRIVPEFYTHTYVRGESRSEYIILIDIPEDIDGILSNCNSEDPLSQDQNPQSPAHSQTASTQIETPLLSEDTISQKFYPRTTQDPISKSTINLRREIMKNRLIDLTGKQHLEFIRGLGEDINFDPYVEKCWHSDFRVHDLPPITEAKLKALPDYRFGRPFTVEEFLKESNIKQKMIDIAMNKVDQEVKTEYLTPSTHSSNIYSHTQETNISSHSNTPSTSSQISPQVLHFTPLKSNIYKEENQEYLSSTLLKKIKAKAEAIAESKRILSSQLENDKLISKKERLERVVDMIRSILLFKKTSSIFLKDLALKLNDRTEGQFRTENEVISDVKELANICPNYIRIIDNCQGALVKVEKSIPFGQIKQKLRKIA